MTDTTVRPTLRSRFSPRVLPTREYLGAQAFVQLVIEVISIPIVAGFAISRATGHHLTPTATATLLIAGPVFNSTITGLITFFGGASDALKGMVTKEGTEKPLTDADPLSPATLWRRAALNAGVAGIWGAGLAFLTLSALNHRLSSFWVLLVGLTVGSGVTTVLASYAGNALGVRLAFDPPKKAPPRPARRRAWVDLGLPVSLIFGVVIALFTLLLFHDYKVGSQFAAHALTEQQIFADLPTNIGFAILVAILVLGRAGDAEARLGLVSFEDEQMQVPSAKGLFGAQVYLYVAAAVLFVVAPVAKLVTPQFPTLAEAMIVRGVLAFSTTYLAGGFAYVRAAGNAKATTATAQRSGAAD